MTPPTVNAYEDPQTNTINFPAGILQPPFFDPAKDDTVNYAAAGAVIGHETIHGYDDQGRKFDEHGNLRDWWTADDAKAYDKRGDCIADEYTEFVPEAGVQQNGRLTQGENTADNGGIHLALSALRCGPESERSEPRYQGRRRADRAATLLSVLCQHLVRQLAPRNDADNSADEPASAGQIPGQQRRVEHVGVRQSLRMPQRAAHGAGKCLPGLVTREFSPRNKTLPLLVSPFVGETGRKR